MSDVEALAAALEAAPLDGFDGPGEYEAGWHAEAILAALHESGWTLAPVSEATPRLGLQPLTSVDERSLPRRARP